MAAPESDPARRKRREMNMPITPLLHSRVAATRQGAGVGPNRQIPLTLWICLLIVFRCAPTFALDRDRSIVQFHYTAWSVKDGAPSEISAFAQTEDGYLWIGSPHGLVRFDGLTFEKSE